MDLLMTTDEIAIPAKSGIAKHKTWRNFAGPDEIDSAMNGIMKAARIAIVQIPALVPISFFFSDFVITVLHVLLEDEVLFSSVG